MSDMETLLADVGVTIEAKLVRKPLAKKSDNWKDTAAQWSVTLRIGAREIAGGKRSLTTEFWTGSGLVNKFGQPQAPSAADVVSSLVLDSSACEESFEEWCDNLGYDTDSRSALETYLQCQKLGGEVRKLLGEHFAACQIAEH